MTHSPEASSEAVHDRGKRFSEIHSGSDAFIIPNPWDVGTAKVLETLGFKALATTSAGYAFSAGVQDGRVARDEMMAHIAAITEAVDLPVSADLEGSYGDSPETVADTITAAGLSGAVGGSIEDRSEDSSHRGLYELGLAVDRIRGAASAAKSLGFDFMLTARCENYLVGNPDLDDTILRLQAYQEAGADVLYAPGVTTRAEIKALVEAVDRPVNVVAGLGRSSLTAPALAELGVRRISVGSALSRTAWTAFLDAAREMIGDGSFMFAEHAIRHGELNSMFSRGSEQT